MLTGRSSGRAPCCIYCFAVFLNLVRSPVLTYGTARSLIVTVGGARSGRTIELRAYLLREDPSFGRPTAPIKK